MVQILADFDKQVESAMIGAWEVANWMEESNHKLTGTIYYKEVCLLDLSLPESFPDVCE